MAVEAERLLITLEASVNRMERELKRGRQNANKEFDGIERRASQMTKNLNNQFAGLAKGLVAPLAGLSGFLGARELIRLTDTWTDLNSRVTQATGSIEKGREAMDRLTVMARRTYSSIEQTTESWLRQRLALDEMGLSMNQQLDLIETLNNSMVISATRGQRAESVQKAWSDAMAQGALRTDGLNTLLAGSPRLVEALAASLGVTVSELRKMASEGTITADKMFGVTSQLEKVRKEADEMAATISDGIQLIQNAFLEYVGRGDEAIGISGQLADALIILADNFEDVADVTLQFATLLAAGLAGRGAALAIGGLAGIGKALAAYIIAVRAGTAANVAFNATLGPLGLLAGVVAGAIFLISIRGDEAAKSMATLTDNTNRLSEINDQLKTATGDVKTALEEEKRALEEASNAIRQNTLEKIKNAEASLAQLKAAQAADGKISRNVLDGAQMRLYQAEQTGDATLIARAQADYNTVASQYAQNPMVDETRSNAINSLEVELEKLRKTLEEQTKIIKGEVPTSSSGSVGGVIPSSTSTKSGREVTGQQIYNTMERFIGLNENRDKNELAAYFKQQGLGNIDPTKTAWCMAIINAVLNENNLPGSGSLMARSAMKLGQATDSPVRGDLVVMKRGNDGRSGHVGLFSGYDENGNVRVLGGNQSDGVNVKSFNKNSVLGYRRIAGVDQNAQSANIQEVIKLREQEAEAARKSGEANEEAYQKIIQGATDSMVAMTDEINGRNLSAVATATLRYEMELLNQAQAAGLDLTDEQVQRLKDMAAQMAETEVAASNLAQMQSELSELAKGAFKGFAQDLLDGKTAAEAFEGVLGRITDKLMDMALDGILQNIFSTGGGGAGGILGGIFKFFGGGRATGGAVSSSKYYMVGEKGPELFAPGKSGTIIPNHNIPQLGKQSAQASMPDIKQQVNFSINNNNGSNVSAKETTPGNFEIDIDNAIAKKIGQSGTKTNSQFQRTFGVRPEMAKR